MNEVVGTLSLFADTLQIAQGTGNLYHSIQSLCRRNENWLVKWGQIESINFNQITKKGGRPNKTQLLNLQQTSALLLMMDNNEQTKKFKEKYINSMVNSVTHPKDKVLSMQAITCGKNIATITDANIGFNIHTKLDKKFDKGKKIHVTVSKNELAIWESLFGHILCGKHNPFDTVVYVLLLENRTVKIGISNNPQKRRNAISTGSGLSIIKHWHTKKMTRPTALKIESMAHSHFSDYRTCGEFFEADFETACNYVRLQTPS